MHAKRSKYANACLEGITDELQSTEVLRVKPKETPQLDGRLARCEASMADAGTDLMQLQAATRSSRDPDICW
jgi:hypothetical protein